MRTLPGMGSHESTRRETDEWLTPPSIVAALGPFDLDPCSPVSRPWDTAAHHYSIKDDGLEMPWTGRVWLNPPYTTITPWMRRMAEHGDGIALTFARTEVAWWHDYVWPIATAFLFVRGRIAFHRDGGPADKPAGAPSVLIAYGESNARAVAESGIGGAFLTNSSPCKWCGNRPVVSRRSRLCDACSRAVTQRAPSDANDDDQQRDIGPRHSDGQEVRE